MKTPRELIERAITVLGCPAMDYAPEIAVKEYQNHITQATKLLLLAREGLST